MFTLQLEVRSLNVVEPFQATKQLLPVPWTWYRATNGDDASCLLVKAMLLKGSSLRFAVLVTNLDSVFVEELDQRALTTRIRTGIFESQESQSQSQHLLTTSNGDLRGEGVIRDTAEEIAEEIKIGKASVEFTQAGFYVGRTLPV